MSLKYVVIAIVLAKQSQGSAIASLRARNDIITPLAKIVRNGQDARSTEKHIFVERASCPFQNSIEKTFARDIFLKIWCDV